MNPRSQLEAILEALKAGETLTSKDAYDRFRCFHLQGRICDLRQGKLGGVRYNIKTKMEPNGNGGRHARYYMETPRLRIIDSIPAFPPKQVENNNSLF